VGETLAETRVEVEQQRAELQRTAERLEARLRYALDVKSRFKENPLLFIGIGAGAAFLVTGGPIRVARLIRRRLRPSSAEQAYDALPKSMQAWVDTIAGGVGPRTAKAREALAGELQAWRLGAVRSKKARKELAKAISDGPPGAERATWKAVEAGLTLVTAALARKAVERFITGGPGGTDASRAAAAASPALPVPPPSAPGAREYSGFSTLARSGNDAP